MPEVNIVTQKKIICLSYQKSTFVVNAAPHFRRYQGVSRI